MTFVGVPRWPVAIAFAALLGLHGCTDGEDETAAETSESAGSSATMTTGGTTSTSGTGGESEGSGTTFESTSTSTGPGTSMTTTSASEGTSDTEGTSDSDTTTTGGAMFPWDGLPPGLVGCTLKAPAGTEVEGESGTHGPFASTRAYFGLLVYDFGEGLEVVGANLVLLGEGADPEVELVSLGGETGQVFEDWLRFNPGEDLLGTHPPPARITKDGMLGFATATVVVDAYAGSWDEPDPEDPPRLLGSASWNPGGAIDAVYCDTLDRVDDPKP